MVPETFLSKELQARFIKGVLKSHFYLTFDIQLNCMQSLLVMLVFLSVPARPMAASLTFLFLGSPVPCRVLSSIKFVLTPKCRLCLAACTNMQRQLEMTTKHMSLHYPWKEPCLKCIVFSGGQGGLGTAVALTECFKKEICICTGTVTDEICSPK